MSYKVERQLAGLTSRFATWGDSGLTGKGSRSVPVFAFSYSAHRFAEQCRKHAKRKRIGGAMFVVVRC